MSDNRDEPRELTGVLVYPVTRPSDQPSFDNYHLGVNPNTGEVYLIFNGEGVTYTVSHNKPWRWSDYNLYSRFYTVIEMIDLADLSKPVDLATQVRRFGSRLDSNLGQAVWALTTDEPYQKDYHAEASKMVLDYFNQKVEAAK